MRTAMMVRGEDRGLGLIGMEAFRHLNPDRTVLVDIGNLARGFAVHPERYPGATTIRWDGTPLDAEAEWVMRQVVAEADVLLGFETWYDARIVDWAAEAGCATALLAMPEFLHPHYPAATVTWNPTRWRQDHMPPGTRVVPLPVALDRFPTPVPRDPDTPLRVLHVAGHRAAHDRNGTTTVLMAARRLRQPVTLTLTGQDGRLPTTPTSKNVTLRLSPQSIPNYWDLYADQDVIVMPRRFGGLCMPVQEAMAAGLAVVMPDCEPNMDWPIIALPAQAHGEIRTGAGDIPMFTINPGVLAAEIDALAVDRERVFAAQAQSREWAEAHSWDALRDVWLAELASACLAARR